MANSDRDLRARASGMLLNSARSGSNAACSFDSLLRHALQRTSPRLTSARCLQSQRQPTLRLYLSSYKSASVLLVHVISLFRSTHFSVIGGLPFSCQEIVSSTLNPKNLINPINPNKPCKTYKPVNPVNPVNPLNPIKPINPINPINPKPYKPYKPCKP